MNFKDWKLVVIAITLLALLAGGFSLFQTSQQLKTSLASLAASQSDLAAAQSILAANQSHLKTTQDKLTESASQVQAANLSLKSVQSSLADTQSQLKTVQDDLQKTNSQLQVSNSKITSIQNSLDAAQKQLDLYKSTFGATVSANIQPPYREAQNLPIILQPNQAASDPTWAQVQAFIQADITDRHNYDLASYTCGDFARDVYNHAEAAGLKCALVAIQFTDGSVAHALNAFRTTDKGLVYIDSTGNDPTQPQFVAPPSKGVYFGSALNWDKLAYLKSGQPYGLISFSQSVNYGLDYAAYQKWTADKQTFDKNLDAYNLRVTADNKAGGVITGSSEALYLKAQSKSLDDLAAKIGAFWQPLSLVSSIDIYW